jgi:ATP-binding cassette subfamily B protein
VVGVDRILVIEGGKISEEGTHKDLLEKKGLYARMWEEYQRSVAWTFGKGGSQ